MPHALLVSHDQTGCREVENRRLVQQQIATDPEFFSRDGALVRLRLPEPDLMEEESSKMPYTELSGKEHVMECAERLTWMQYDKGATYIAYIRRHNSSIATLSNSVAEERVLCAVLHGYRSSTIRATSAAGLATTRQPGSTTTSRSTSTFQIK
jgi:hypothetical protein